MALPAEYNTGTVTGNYVKLTGEQEAGKVTFRARATRLVADESNVVIIGAPIVVQLVAGAFSVELPATDDPDISPNGFTYQVTEEFTDGYVKRYDIDVPAGSTTDLSEVISVDPEAGEVVIRSGGGGRSGDAWVMDTDGSPITELNLGDTPYKDKATIFVLSTRTSGDPISITMGNASAEGEFALLISATNGSGQQARWSDRVTFVDPAPVTPAGGTLMDLPAKALAVRCFPGVNQGDPEISIWLATPLFDMAAIALSAQWNPEAFIGMAPVVVLGYLIDIENLESAGLVGPIVGETYGQAGSAPGSLPFSVADIPEDGWMSFTTSPDSPGLAFFLPLGYVMPFIGGPMWMQQRFTDATGQKFTVTAYFPNVPTDDSADFDAWVMAGGKVAQLTAPAPATTGTPGEMSPEVWFAVKTNQYTGPTPAPTTSELSIYPASVWSCLQRVPEEFGSYAAFGSDEVLGRLLLAEQSLPVNSAKIFAWDGGDTGATIKMGIFEVVRGNIGTMILEDEQTAPSSADYLSFSTGSWTPDANKLYAVLFQASTTNVEIVLAVGYPGIDHGADDNNGRTHLAGSATYGTWPGGVGGAGGLGAQKRPYVLFLIDD